MTRISAEEDFSLTSPETIAADIRQGQIGGVWQPAAIKLGWFWSPAHGGYINEGDRSQGIGWDSYRVADDAEGACFASGVETLAGAIAVLSA